MDEEAGRALFYVFVESTHAPASDPVVLWLNGGPGCSSLGGGFLAELGPFYPTPGGQKLIPNKFAWNTYEGSDPAACGWKHAGHEEHSLQSSAATWRLPPSAATCAAAWPTCSS